MNTRKGRIRQPRRTLCLTQHFEPRDPDWDAKAREKFRSPEGDGPLGQSSPISNRAGVRSGLLLVSQATDPAARFLPCRHYAAPIVDSAGRLCRLQPLMRQATSVLTVEYKLNLLRIRADGELLIGNRRGG